MPYCETLRGINTFYEDWGMGLPIIFIHPPGMGRKVFFYQQRLAENLRIILFDLRGHGDTVGNPDKVSILWFVEEIKSLMDVLQIEKAVICGYSSGGIIAQEFSLHYPDRVMGVILSGGFAEVQSMIFKFQHLIGMYFVKHYPMLLAKVIAENHTNFEPLKKALITHMLKANRRVWFEFYHQSLSYTCVERLQELKAPLLLMYGSKDYINQHVRAYQKRINPQIAIIKKAYHQLPVRNWKIFNRLIIDFAINHS